MTDMDYLRQQFNNELRATIDTDPIGFQKISIGVVEFTTDQVLQGLDPIAYEDAFTEWLEERKKRLIRLADDILNLYTNRDRFQMLLQAYKHGSVIPFIGAGMSMSSGYIGWTAFLNRLREETNISKRNLSILLKDGKYEEAAQLLADNMPENAFNEQLDMYFGQERPLAGAVRSLPQFFNSAVITTNFDDVVQKCYASQGVSFADTLLGVDAHEIRRQLGQGTRVLVKLHGRARSSIGRILTYKEYESHYGLQAPIPEVINAICVKTLLFLGCSLTIDRTVKAMEHLAIQHGGSAVRRYAFLPLKSESQRVARSHSLAKSNIFPIWYPSDADHDEVIEALLVKLKEA